MKNKIILIAILAVVFASCHNNHETEKHEEHEEAKIQFTAYSNEFELFAEADPLVVGKSSNVLSHFSHLPSFKALETGSMTIRLIVNGKETKQTLDKPTRKGIYSFDIKPETKGNGQIVFDIKTEKGNFQVNVPHATVFATEQEADDAAGKVVVSKTNTTVFTKEQSWKIEYSTDLPKKEPFGQIIKTTAQILSSQGDEIIISAKTNGIITLTNNSILEGNEVSTGKILFSISGSGLADNNSMVRFAEAKNNFEKAKADYERMQELKKDKIVSEKDLLISQNQYDNTKAIYDNLNKNFSLTGQNIKSPMNGFVKQVFVQNGTYVESGQRILTVTQNKTLVLHAEVQQKYAAVLGSINSANIRTLHDNQTYTLEQLNGKVLSYGKTTNTDNYLIPVNLQIDNTGSFVAGGFVELYIKTLTNSQALTIPNTSLMEEQGNFFVYVQITPELFEKREVKTGATDGLKTEILKGITYNERIVSKGAIILKLAQATGTLDAHSGHVH
jgi:cobalt-zinc-cadmium efflux system membrane fusion protein